MTITRREKLYPPPPPPHLKLKAKVLTWFLWFLSPEITYRIGVDKK
jgi:hypothetical protein